MSLYYHLKVTHQLFMKNAYQSFNFEDTCVSNISWFGKFHKFCIQKFQNIYFSLNEDISLNIRPISINKVSKFLSSTDLSNAISQHVAKIITSFQIYFFTLLAYFYWKHALI